MKKLKFVFIMLLIILNVGCNSIDTKTIEEYEKQITDNHSEISKLEKKVDNLTAIINDYKKEKEYFPVVSNLAAEFVKAHTTGNKEKIIEMLSDKYTIEERNNNIYLNFELNQEKVEMPLYKADSQYKYQEMVLQGFGYESDQDIYRVHIREYYVDKNNDPVSPPTFLNLTFKLEDNLWKIVDISFDV